MKDANSTLAASAVTKLRLPHPYLTTFYAVSGRSDQTLRIRVGETQSPSSKPLPLTLHNDDLTYTALQAPKDVPDASNNSSWARARRSHHTTIAWRNSTPSLPQIWLVIYMLFTQSPDHETFRLSLEGADKDSIASQLKQETLAIDHPTPSRAADKGSNDGQDELLILRSTFWQGAASPFGHRSIWIPEGGGSANVSTVDYTMTTKTPEFNQVHAWHPRRAAKPRPGTTIYSRYIPALDEHFSMAALDYTNPEHLNLFHTWQNDPRVAAGWNETGDLDHHRTYLRNLHEDPHVLTVLAYWDDTPFAYFEIYWAAEDHLGAHYQADGFDRGRHALVGNDKFRGRHRVTAWWSATMHYIFLDDPRTMRVVGEPKYVNTSVLAYDLMHGFGVQKFVDLGHKRSALMMCPRERYFQLGMDQTQEGVVGGTYVAVGVPKL
ncbi:hypothetical protein PMZ80_011082 [Knufia obscura]|uniref:Acyltransferase MbtK/IucB-like conserved domain-containing protein n=2 Tax=Knufia TaxID=430999 RepID=A0AAN8IHN7_9EURO|nr:hypothetical protein PMZ80_011082 [Knufia obscura]KAK5948232.1 hypothetical protein OHC33_010780 [Knufia fluminis]